MRGSWYLEGTVNDFASSNRIPKDMLAAAQIAISDNIVKLDAGKFNENYFSYIAAFGFGTGVAYETDQKMKNKLGSIAYGIEILKDIDIKRFEEICRCVNIKIGEEEIMGNFVFGAVTNSLSVAGMKQLVSQDSVMDDGILECLFMRKPKTIIELERVSVSVVEQGLSIALPEK